MSSTSGIAFLLVVLSVAVEANLNARVTNLERSLAMNRQMTNMMTARITTAERRDRMMTEQLTRLTQQVNTQIAELTEANRVLREQNDELQVMLGTFERFFGSLLVEAPESFDPTRHAMERINTLNAFLGNRKATLAGLNPDPITVPANDSVDPETLGRALTELSEVNSNLRRQVTRLENRVDNGVIGTADRSLTGGSDDIFTLSECRQQLVNIEAMVNSLTAVQLEQDTASRLSGSTNVISDRDREILEGAAYGDRSLTSARKSVFSVAIRKSTHGSSAAKHIAFDYVFVNKGNHWNETSNTFVAGITGYYFFTVTLRTYDSRFIGVALMKNDNLATAISSDPSDRNVMESQSLVLHLEVGDRVWLRLGPSPLYGMHSDDFNYCTFTGFLVYKGR
ncbi:uncharacterized protein [Diadema antillarum]|uniref:uncharacterized protein n=1 Tax=Diadema antillarum TaxID=105358 RepID=UPI003A8A276B